MDLKRKLMVGLMALVGVVSLAHADKFTDRTKILEKYKDSKNITSIGWYVGVTEEMEIRNLINRYLPLSNYLSDRLNSLTVLQAEKNDRSVAKEAISGNLEMVYTSAIMGSQLVKGGWQPVVGRENINPVLLMKSSTKIKTTDDLKGKKLVAAYGATVTMFMQYSLLKDGVLKDIEDPNFVIRKVSQQDLINLLKTGQVDGVVVRDTFANNLIKDNPNQYAITYKSQVAPGHTLFVGPSFDKNKIPVLKDSFLTLTPETEDGLNILSGLDGFQKNNKKPFKEVTVDDLKNMGEVFSLLKEEPLVKPTVLGTGTEALIEKNEIVLNKYSKRHELALKYDPNKSTNIGWYVGVVDDTELRSVLNRYLPLSNFLTEKLNNLVVIQPDKVDRSIAKNAVESNFDMVYTSALMGTELVKMGWKPVVGREDLVPVIVSKNSLKVSKLEDLKGKKIVAPYGGTTTMFIHYSLIKDKILNSKEDPNYIIKKINQNDLINLLKTGQVDGVVVRDNVAARLIKENPGQYKQIYKGKTAPGHMLFASPKFPDDKYKLIKDLFLNLTPENEEGLYLLAGIDGFSKTNAHPFKEIQLSDLEDTKEVFKTMGEAPLVK